jgi:hypothetical protein
MEPPRLASAAAAPPAARARARPSAPRCETPVEAARTPSGLDLNRATPRELARLAGISRGLAARIVAARDGLDATPAGGAAGSTGRARFASPRRWVPSAPAQPVDPEPAPSSPLDPDSADLTTDAPSE